MEFKMEFKEDNGIPIGVRCEKCYGYTDNWVTIEYKCSTCFGVETLPIPFTEFDRG